ncbi:MAG: PLDc N-terminal domain-containing protein [Verrucomicrobiae bacterium]|nr:PLDc N-terminal domain-containing protein [Verrucomicrobiae bacterium]
MAWWAEAALAWEYGVLAVGLILAIWASGHALAYKRDPRAATLWIGLVWLLPVVGALLYSILGVNRIRRWAVSLRADMQRVAAEEPTARCRAEQLTELLGDGREHLEDLARTVDRVASRPLVRGNRVEPLIDGDEAFPFLLEAIRGAQRSIAVCTYIFDADAVGLELARELGEAVRRGVEVRVLIDATGVRYSWPPILGTLRREGVRHARFLRLFPIRRVLSMNLRNHRKIVVVDGRVGFTGGMNLRMGHWLGRRPRRPVRDVHFRLEGPVVAHLQEAFAEDWQFTTGEALRGETWFPALPERGPVAARGIADGPDEDLDQMRWVLLAALSAAKESVRIVTPYFLPEAALIAALNVAAMRGVRVDIVLPSRSNLPVVHGASRAHWWQVLEHGCRIWLSPPPFDHTKLMVVDGAWAMFGSANWDPRSLRLNFEFNVESYDTALAGRLEAVVEEKRARAREVTLAEVDGRSMGVRLWDGVARLFTPFL